MIGHDIVPHTDLTKGEIISTSIASITGSEQITHEHEQEHSALGHIFEHYQHYSNDRSSDYVSVDVKTLDTKTKTFQNSALIGDIYNGFIWYANFEKQRFRDYSLFPYFSTLSSNTLRGPPSC